MSAFVALILIVSSLFLYFFYNQKIKLTYWEKRGVPYLKPVLFFGNFKDAILQKYPSGLVIHKLYKELEGHKFGGLYQLSKPTLLIRDPELVNTVLVKNFASFHDRFWLNIDENVDNLLSSILSLSGPRWRNLRYKLTPAFSSSKLRQMESLMKDCVRELDGYLRNATSGSSETRDGDVQDVRELMAKFSIDIIGSCILGFRCNSVQEEESEFRRISRLMIENSNRYRFYDLLQVICPRLISVLKMKKVNQEVEEFFMSVHKQSLKHREYSVQKRSDLVQLMIDIQAEEKMFLQRNGYQQNGHHKNDPHSNDMLITDTVIASNAIGFFAAGFDSIANTLSYCLYELALNPEICEKIIDEMERVKRAHNNNMDYDAMKKLVYMEAVISETLRKYPVGSAVFRQCTEAFEIPDTSVVVEKGTSLIISVYGLHHDPKYFPKPEKFLPDRFNEKNIGSIVPGSYLPFGDGPRMCIASRFAIFALKSALANLVSNYTFHTCEKTAIPIKFDVKSKGLGPQGGLWLRVQRRHTSREPNELLECR